MSAGDLAGLLADVDRLRCVAALALGALTVADVRRATGLDAREAATAIERLVRRGLVERGADGTLVLLTGAFGRAARHAVPSTSPSDEEHAGADPDTARVLRSFVRDGRLLSIPASRAKRRVVLDVLAQEFEPGRRYSERMVNLVLGRWHADTAALRRYLVDEGFMDRDRGEYWRAGGTVELD